MYAKQIMHKFATGLQINYYYICKRKLWFYSKELGSEKEYEPLGIEKIYGESIFSDENKGFQFGPVKIDSIDMKNKVIQEVKESDKAREAHVRQLKYNLYYFRKNGIGEFTGEIYYPAREKTVQVELSLADEKLFDRALDEITSINALQAPPPIEVGQRICRSCSYYNYCFG